MTSTDKRQRTIDGGAPGASAALERVHQVQNRLEEINDEVAAQILLLQSKANTARAPVYESRRAAIAGVPDFWKCTFQGHPWICNLITPRDAVILSHLVELEVVENPDIRSGYVIRLVFSANPYFTNAVVEKRLSYRDGGELTMSTTRLEWKEGQGPELSDDDDAADAEGKKRSFEAMEDEAQRLPLFILTLLSDELPEADSGSEGMVETEQMCEAIKDEVWPEPLKYFHAASR